MDLLGSACAPFSSKHWDAQSNHPEENLKAPFIGGCCRVGAVPTIRDREDQGQFYNRQSHCFRRAVPQNLLIRSLLLDLHLDARSCHGISKGPDVSLCLAPKLSSIANENLRGGKIEVISSSPLCVPGEQAPNIVIILSGSVINRWGLPYDNAASRRATRSTTQKDRRGERE